MWANSEHFQFIPLESPFSLSLFPITVFSAGTGSALATFLNGGGTGTPRAAFCRQNYQIPFSFFSGSIFEAFNYFSFYKDPLWDFS